MNKLQFVKNIHDHARRAGAPNKDVFWFAFNMSPEREKTVRDAICAALDAGHDFYHALQSGAGWVVATRYRNYAAEVARANKCPQRGVEYDALFVPNTTSYLVPVPATGDAAADSEQYAAPEPETREFLTSGPVVTKVFKDNFGRERVQEYPERVVYARIRAVNFMGHDYQSDGPFRII